MGLPGEERLDSIAVSVQERLVTTPIRLDKPRRVLPVCWILTRAKLGEAVRLFITQTYLDNFERGDWIGIEQNLVKAAARRTPRLVFDKRRIDKE